MCSAPAQTYSTGSSSDSPAAAGAGGGGRSACAARGSSAGVLRRRREVGVCGRRATRTGCNERLGWAATSESEGLRRETRRGCGEYYRIRVGRKGRGVGVMTKGTGRLGMGGCVQNGYRRVVGVVEGGGVGGAVVVAGGLVTRG